METIFVSALPFNMTEDELRDLFEKCGTVASVTLNADWEDATFEPYAHITMENADTAIQTYDGFIIGATYLRVNKLISVSK